MTKPSRTDLIFVGFATFAGLIIRIAVPLTSAFPLNDGGLFFSMILDLQANHYVLPAATTYNAASIPFAYPPAAFYFYGILNSSTGIPLLVLMRLLPAIISALSIPAFFMLAQEMLASKAQVALSTLIFALVPRAFDWLIMGGGITRSMGLLLALLAMRQAYILFSSRSSKSLLPMIALSSLVVYTHPEATIHTILTSLLFFLWKGCSRKGLLFLAAIAVGVALVTSPWWLTIITRYGVNPFLAAAKAARQDSYNAFAGIFVLFRFDFADEPYVSLISALGLIGFFYLLAKKKYLLPLWLVVMHTFEPRGGPLFMMIPLAMYAGVAIEQVILPQIRVFNKRLTDIPENSAGESSNWLEEMLQGRVIKLFIGFVFVYGMMSAYYIAWKIKQDFTLTNVDLQAFNWIKSNTPANSRFALITGGLPLRDSSSEWFPALTGRQSVATVFGYEWVNDGLFGRRTEEFRNLQSCANQNIDCLDAWTQESGQRFSYVYLHALGESTVADLPLAVYLNDSVNYEVIYKSEEIEIFSKK